LCVPVHFFRSQFIKLQLVEKSVQALEVAGSEAAVLLEPFSGLGERLGFQAAGAALRVAAARDETGALQDFRCLEMDG
jgi:hypothetical protein